MPEMRARTYEDGLRRALEILGEHWKANAAMLQNTSALSAAFYAVRAELEKLHHV